MGSEGRPGGSAAELTAGLRSGYDAAAGGWAGGPGRMYSALAQALIAAAPLPLAGRRVLDLGAGTGVAGREALAAGAAQVVGVDLAEGMLRLGGATLHPVAADVIALPFADHSFDLVIAAFCLNHLSDITAGLREARRVGRTIAASMFAPGWSHPAKNAVDEALRRSGYREPRWYLSLIRENESQAGGPDVLAEQAVAAGFSQVQVRTAAVPTPLVSPPDLVSWRLGMAHIAPFMRGLDAESGAAVRHAAEYAVAGAGPLVVSMVILTAS